MKKNSRKIPAILTAFIVAVSAIALMSFAPASVSFAEEASDTVIPAASVVTDTDPAEAADTVSPQTEDQDSDQPAETVSEQPSDTDPAQAEDTNTVQEADSDSAQTSAPESSQPAKTDSGKAKTEETASAQKKTDNKVSLQEAFTAEDGKYYVDITLFDTDKDEAAAWSAVFKSNSHAYVTVSDNKITTVEIATNPAKNGKYESAVTKMQIGSTALKAAKTADFTTIPADKDIKYIARTSFTMPDSGQPDLQDAETFVPVKLVIPDVDSKNTDKETWQDARLKFSWKTLTSTDDKELKQDATIASSDDTPFISADPALINIDKGKSVSLKAKIINGKDYEFSDISIDKTDIATISNWKVDAKSTGSAVITITAVKTDNGKTVDTLTRKVKVTVKEPSYTVTVTDDGHGSASADPEKGTEGTKVTLAASPSDGYQFKEWQVVSGGVSVADDSFTIGTSDVEVKAIFEEIPAVTYNVTVSVEGTGEAVADPGEGPEGTVVTLTATPGDGYKFKEWKVVSGEVSITDNKFPIGTSDVEIKAVFEEDTPQPKTYTDQKTNIVVTDNTGILPAGAKLVVTEITSGAEFDKVNNSTYVAGKPFKLYDIHFEDANGTKLNPEGRFTINIPIPSSFSKSSLMLIHYYDSGRVTSVSGTVSGDIYKFTTKSFSNFALVDKSSVQPTTKQQPTTKKNTPTTKKNTVTTKKSTNAKTGDEANTMMWVALLVIAAAAIAAILIIRRRPSSTK